MNAGQSYILSARESNHWYRILDRCIFYDIYHSPAYHRVAEEQGEGKAHLFVFELGDTIIALPMLLRQCADVPGLESSPYQDATTVYGYPGPLSNSERHSQEELTQFNDALYAYLKAQKIISIFSRLNPLCEQASLFKVGESLEIGPTVSIDLKLSVEEQYQRYRKSHRYDIERAKREGLTCIHDKNWLYLERFIDIYHQTMHRVKADDYYFFDRAYFSRLHQLLGDNLHLFVAIKENQVVSGALFFYCNKLIQYHLSGTDTKNRALAPNKLVLDTVRCWGNEIGATTLHLGGGVGGKKDGLFRFKAGFSNQVHLFKIWRMIVDQEAYQHQLRQRQIWCQTQGLKLVNSSYFPAYRSTTQKLSPCN